MGNNHLRRSSIPKSATSLKKEPTYLNKDVTNLHSFEQENDDAKVIVNIRHLQYEYQCLSSWSKTEEKELWEFTRRLHRTTWRQVYESASKGKKKRGLAYTIIPRNQYPQTEFIRSLSPDVTLFELRVSKKMRVHGFRYKSVFYLCYLDREHKLVSR